jgi:hypothetical protein
MFYLIVEIIESDMDFGFYKDGEALEDGTTIHASGETPKEAIENFNKAYKVSAYMRKDYLHPDQMHEGFRNVKYVHQLFTQELFKYLETKDEEDLPGDMAWKEPDGCFQTCLLGNWDVLITLTKEAPVLKDTKVDTGDRVIQHGKYLIRLCLNGDIQIEHKDSQIVWVDNHYMSDENVPDGAEHQKGLPSVIINAVNQDEPSICLSIGDDKVFINDINRDLTEDKR